MSESASQAANPLLADPPLPDFPAIQAEHVVPAIEQLIERNRQALQARLASDQPPTWENLVEPFEAGEDALARAFSPVSHLNGVMNSQSLREAYQQALQLLTQYHTEVTQNTDLYRAYQALADSDEFAKLSQPQQKTINNALRDFKLAGVALEDEQKQRYGEIRQRLSTLSNQFSNNVLDATQGWFKVVETADALQGLPDSAIAAAQQAAEQKDVAGYVITLDIPAYLAVMKYADDRALRKEVYRAFVTRASDRGFATHGKDPADWDNQPLMDEILALRHEMAQLLGFNNYAELSLATKMAESTEEVMDFLNQLATTARPAAEQEYAELRAFAEQEYGITDLAAWDMAYYSEKQRQQVYAVSEEELRPYFPAAKVIEGLFAVAGRLFNVSFVKDDAVATWHPDARYYRVERNGAPLAGFYLDIYARENKRGGAWMDECRVRRRRGDSWQLPVAYLTCNFGPPTRERPSLLTHNEVTTLFHEFGHGLHHMLTQIDAPAVSGINGVAWDAVELPSQFLENWCWQAEVIPLISAHYQTGEPLPKDLLDKLLRAKNYQSAMQTVRQLEFSLFDFRLHREYNPDQPQSIQALLDKVRDQVAVVIPPDYNRFQHSFSHIFAGGYAAGYYSYKWAEVLSSDAFSLFEERGIFDPATAEAFLAQVLEQGGSRDAMELFVAFRGRKPSIEPLLRHNGITVNG